MERRVGERVEQHGAVAAHRDEVNAVACWLEDGAHILAGAQRVDDGAAVARAREGRVELRGDAHAHDLVVVPVQPVPWLLGQRRRRALGAGDERPDHQRGVARARDERAAVLGEREARDHVGVRAQRLERAAVGEQRALERVVPVAAREELETLRADREARRHVLVHPLHKRHAKQVARRALRVDVERLRLGGVERPVRQPAVRARAAVGRHGDDALGARNERKDGVVGELPVEVEPRLPGRAADSRHSLLEPLARAHRPVGELRGRVAKVDDLRLGGRALVLVLDRVQVDRALVRQVVEDVERVLGRRAALLVAEDEVDPARHRAARVRALERRAHRAHVAPRGATCPRGQHHVPQRRAVLPAAEVEAVEVEQRLRQVEDLRDELLDAARVVAALARRELPLFAD
mmetsp:Transcript_51422/g.142293  ORF Transcript_51422/g.142293 Transcript_51422/m.142293 type:complete len:406 (+) Transcript_51422:672-1889(+)